MVPACSLALPGWAWRALRPILDFVLHSIHDSSINQEIDLPLFLLSDVGCEGATPLPRKEKKRKLDSCERYRNLVIGEQYEVAREPINVGGEVHGLRIPLFSLSRAATFALPGTAPYHDTAGTRNTTSRQRLDSTVFDRRIDNSDFRPQKQGKVYGTARRTSQ